MENPQPSLVEKAKAHLLSWLLPALGTLALGAILWLEESLQKFIPEPQSLWAVRAIGISVLLLCLLVALYFWFRPKLISLSWGVHQDVKTGAYFCTKCLITETRHSPLYLYDNGKVWRCSACHTIRDNPEYKKPPEPVPTNRSKYRS